MKEGGDRFGEMIPDRQRHSSYRRQGEVQRKGQAVQRKAPTAFEKRCRHPGARSEVLGLQGVQRQGDAGLSRRKVKDFHIGRRHGRLPGVQYAGFGIHGPIGTDVDRSASEGVGSENVHHGS